MTRRDTALRVALLADLPLLIILLFAFTAEAGSQQASASGDASLTELPPKIQARLSRLQADVASARSLHDNRKQAAALIQLGDLDLVIYELPNALDSYQQALALARTPADPQLQATALN